MEKAAPADNINPIAATRSRKCRSVHNSRRLVTHLSLAALDGSPFSAASTGDCCGLAESSMNRTYSLREDVLRLRTIPPCSKAPPGVKSHFLRRRDISVPPFEENLVGRN